MKFSTYFIIDSKGVGILEWSMLWNDVQRMSLSQGRISIRDYKWMILQMDDWTIDKKEEERLYPS